MHKDGYESQEQINLFLDKVGKVGKVTGGTRSRSMSMMWIHVEKIDGRGHFSVWQCVVKDVLIQQRLIDAFEVDRLEKTFDED